MFEKFTTMEILGEITVVEQYITLMEDRSAFLSAQLGERLFSEYKYEFLEDDDEENQLVRQGFREIAAKSFPEYVRSASILLLWSLYESSIIRIAEAWRKKERVFTTITRKNEKGFIESHREYYRDIINISITETDIEFEQIKLIYYVRNSLIHGKGKKGNVPNSTWRRIEELAKLSNVTITRGNELILSKAFIENSFQVIDRTLHRLIDLLIPL